MPLMVKRLKLETIDALDHDGLHNILFRYTDQAPGLTLQPYDKQCRHQPLRKEISLSRSKLAGRGMSLTLVRLALLPEFFGSSDLTIHKCVLGIQAVMGEYIGFL